MIVGLPMAHKLRCPICGNLTTLKKIDKFYPIEFFNVRGLGKGRGFSFQKTEDPSLFRSLKAKILALYHKFCVGSSYTLIERITMSPSEQSTFVANEKVSFNLRR
jgi:hypothetical protein